MAGEDQDLVGVGQFRESGGGAERPSRVEVYENFIDNDGERLRSLSKFADQSEAEGQEKLLACAAAQFGRLLALPIGVHHRDRLLTEGGVHLPVASLGDGGEDFLGMTNDLRLPLALELCARFVEQILGEGEPGPVAGVAP